MPMIAELEVVFIRGILTGGDRDRWGDLKAVDDLVICVNEVSAAEFLARGHGGRGQETRTADESYVSQHVVVSHKPTKNASFEF